MEGVRGPDAGNHRVEVLEFLFAEEDDTKKNIMSIKYTRAMVAPIDKIGIFSYIVKCKIYPVYSDKGARNELIENRLKTKSNPPTPTKNLKQTDGIKPLLYDIREYALPSHLGNA